MSKKLLLFLVMGGALFSFCASQCEAGPVISTKAQVAVDNAREALKTKEWIVYLTSEGGKATGESDVITFTAEDKVSSRNLFAKGYSDSNFRLVLDASGTAIWETMKVDKDNNLAFLRGELRGNVMTGSVFMKSTRGATESYYYTTAVSAATPVSVTPETTTTTTTTTKRGRK